MSPNTPALQPSRKHLAVGVWTLLVVLMALITSDISVSFSIGIVSIVSVLNLVAIILIGKNGFIEPNSIRWHQSVLFTVSIAIPLAWAVLLGWRSSTSAMAAFTAIGCIPAMIAWLSLMSGDARIAGNVLVQASRERIASETDPERPSQLDSHDNAKEPAETEIVTPLRAFPAASHNEPESLTALDVTQWLTRSRTVGGEKIEGGVRIRFDAGQRDATVHVSFCPPFHCIPDVKTKDMDAADLEIRVAVSFPFGARLTVRRPAAKNDHDRQAPAVTYRIGFVAIAAASRRAA